MTCDGVSTDSKGGAACFGNNTQSKAYLSKHVEDPMQYPRIIVSQPSTTYHTVCASSVIVVGATHAMVAPMSGRELGMSMQPPFFWLTMELERSPEVGKKSRIVWKQRLTHFPFFKKYFLRPAN